MFYGFGDKIKCAIDFYTRVKNTCFARTSHTEKSASRLGIFIFFHLLRLHMCNFAWSKFSYQKFFRSKGISYNSEKRIFQKRFWARIKQPSPDFQYLFITILKTKFFTLNYEHEIIRAVSHLGAKVNRLRLAKFQKKTEISHKIFFPVSFRSNGTFWTTIALNVEE